MQNVLANYMFVALFCCSLIAAAPLGHAKANCAFYNCKIAHLKRALRGGAAFENRGFRDIHILPMKSACFEPPECKTVNRCISRTFILPKEVPFFLKIPEAVRVILSEAKCPRQNPYNHGYRDSETEDYL